MSRELDQELEIELINGCLKKYRKYGDTVAISAAVCHFFKENQEFGVFMGFEPNLKRVSKDSVSPDMAALYDNSTKGIIFEIKWSLPKTEEYLEKELTDLKKYFDEFINWNNDSGRVIEHDVVLICHSDDVDKVKEMIKKISMDDEYDFFNKKGFAIWTWLLTPPKYGERNEEMRIMQVYGNISNVELEKRVIDRLGLLVPEEVLTHLRFIYLVVKEKPPISWLLNILIVNILPCTAPHLYDEYYEVDTDFIYKKSLSVITAGEQYEEHALRVKRKWIREALKKLVELNIINKGRHDESWKIPTRLLPSRKPRQEVICKKLAQNNIKIMKKRRRGRSLKIKTIKPTPTGKERKITEFF